MPQPLPEALADVRAVLLDRRRLVRAVGAGRRGGSPRWTKVQLRPVSLRAGDRLQVTAYDERQAHTSNHAWGADAQAAVDGLLAEPFGNWHVDAVDETLQVRVTKRGEAQVHRSPRSVPAAAATAHDRRKPRLLDPEDAAVRAYLTAVGVADAQGRVKPSRQAKYRQVEEFVRLLDSALADATTAGVLRGPTADSPWRVVDLGCGNGYLTAGAYAFLRQVRGLPVRIHGVDVRADVVDHDRELVEGLGWSDVSFEQATIADADVEGALGGPPDVVLALHACDTATDDALARAARWEAPVVLAAPCCHHDVQAQLAAGGAAAVPEPYGLLTRHGLLRERWADVLTDALRAGLLRREGYRVDAVEFVADEHTPRNLMLRAVRTGSTWRPAERQEYEAIVAAWGLRPALAERLDGST